MKRSLLVHVQLNPWGASPGNDPWEWLEPLLSALSEARSVGVVLSGRLIEQASRRFPEGVGALRLAASEGRLEPVAVPLFEPVLGSVPERDAVGQLKAHVTLLKQGLGVRASGVWIPHGEWDPGAPRMLNKAGLTWTSLPAAWLRACGFEADRLSVERDGRSVVVLPHHPVSKAGWTGLGVVAVRTAADARTALEALEQSECLPGELTVGRRSRAYLREGCAEGVWARHLLADPAADVLHKHMLAVSTKVRRLRRATDADRHADEGPDPLALHQARRYLFRAQTAQAYVSETAGVKAGDRDAAWRDLLRADRQVADALHSAPAGTNLVDLDCDGEAELLLHSSAWAVTIAPADSGSFRTIAWRPGAINVLGGAVPSGFVESWGEAGDVAPTWELITREVQVSVSRAVLAAASIADGQPVRVTKRIELAPETLAVMFDVQNRGDNPVRTPLATTLHVALGADSTGEVPPAVVHTEEGPKPLHEAVDAADLSRIALTGGRATLELRLTPNARVTVEPAGEGTARIRICWPVELWPRDRERREVRLAIHEDSHA